MRERDIDLLFCSELHARGEVARLLAAKLGDPSAVIDGAWVSYTDIDGETDLRVDLSGSGGRVVALIENKISAPFQPNQGERYRARAARLSESGVRVVTVLVAPKDYHGGADSELFEVRISYEEIADAVEASADRRSKFFAEALLGAVETGGYNPVPDPAVSAMWEVCWELSQGVTPKLRFQKPGPRPGRSVWIYFREADGVGPGAPAVVVYKAGFGQADLQFKGTTAAELAARVDPWLEPDMRVVRAGKSASVRVAVPVIDFQRSAELQRAAIRTGLEACERLRTLYVERLVASPPTKRAAGGRSRRVVDTGGHDPVPDPAVSAMWRACWELSQRVTPKLRFKQPGPRPRRAIWIHFREADGVGPGAPAIVVYKAGHGHADLQFRGTTTAELAARVDPSWLEPDMQVAQAQQAAQHSGGGAGNRFPTLG